MVRHVANQENERNTRLLNIKMRIYEIFNFIFLLLYEWNTKREDEGKVRVELVNVMKNREKYGSTTKRQRRIEHSKSTNDITRLYYY